jgi:HEAT repeat protein
MPSEPFRSGGADDAPIIAQALSDRGEAALQFGDLPGAAAALQEAVARWRELEEPGSLAGALNNLGVAYARMKQPERAVPLLSEAAHLFNANGKAAGEATALNALGAAHADMRNYEQALVHLRAALPLRRQTGDERGELLTLDLLARVCSLAGEHLAALGYRREHVEAVRARGDRRAEADAMVELAGVLSSAGYDAEATKALGEAAGIYEQLGDLREAGETLLKLAMAHFEAGDMAAAVAPVEQALPMLRQAGAWGPQAMQWESFLFSRRMQQELQGALGQWRRGQPGGIEHIVEVLRERLDPPGSHAANPLNEQLLDMLAGAATRLAGISPALRPATHPEGTRPAPPSTDDLAAQDTRSTPDLIAALRSTEAPQRRKAALALGVRCDPGGVEPLIEACEDRNQWVRMAAVRSLGKLRDGRALDALRSRVEEDRDKEVRRSAATALGALGDRRAVDALTVALTDSYFRTVESAEKALRKLKAPPNISVFVALLRHKDPARRMAAADRLARLGDASAAGPLAQEAENSDQPLEVRVAMLDALGKLKDRRGLEAALRVLDDAPAASAAPLPKASEASLPKASEASLPKASEASLPKASEASLPKASGKPEEGVDRQVRLKQAALGVLAAAEDASGMAYVTSRLVSYLSDASPYVRHAAARALGAVGDETAIPALERVQQSDDGTVQVVSQTGVQWARLRSAAAEAIGRIRGRNAG